MQTAARALRAAPTGWAATASCCNRRWRWCRCRRWRKRDAAASVASAGGAAARGLSLSVTVGTGIAAAAVPCDSAAGAEYTHATAMPTTTTKAHAAWLARLTGRCDAGQRADNSDHERGSSATHCAAGSSVLSVNLIKFAEKGRTIKAGTGTVMFSQSRKQKGAPVPRFLSVFLAFGGLRPWFCLSTVVTPPIE